MRVLFLGMGSIGSRHYRLLKNIAPNFEYFAYCRGQRTCPVPGPEELHSWDDVEKAGIDVAFICNPTSKHVETAIECAKRGINLFIEKPLSNSLERIDELHQYIDKYEVKVIVGFNLRFHPIIERIKDIIPSNKNNVLRFSACCGSYLPGWRGCDYRKTYSASAALGGGVILDLIHELDYCTWIFGQPTSIKGHYGKYSALELDVEDTAEMILQYPKYLGVIHVDYYRPIPKRMIEIITSTSVIEADLLAGTLSITTCEGTSLERFNTHEDTTYLNQLAHVISVIEGHEKPRTTFEESVGVLRLALDFKKQQGE